MRFPSHNRKPTMEQLEARQLLSSVPFGASPDDTAEYMIGDVLVSVVLLESDGSIDPSSENWTRAQIENVKDTVRNGLKWWEDLLAAQSTVHSLNFQIDFSLADDPVETGYEPIQRRSNDFSLWIEDFFAEVGSPSEGTFSSRIREFNHQQRVEHGTDWAFTIFVVNAAEDPDHRFERGGDHSLAFAFAGGRFFVMTSERGAPTVAHETAHMFWGMDEYSGSKTFYDRRGYYNTQNRNAVDRHPAPNSRVQSIMDIQGIGYANNALSPSGKETIGWRDSDRDGIFDVLDVPLVLNGQGLFDSAKSNFRFTGNAYPGTMTNQNPSGTGNDISINRISDIEYRLDGGRWLVASRVDLPIVSFDISLNIPPDTRMVEFRAIDNESGITSAIYRSSIGQIGVVIWTNPGNANDINNDGEVTAIDALLIINELNSTGPRRLTAEENGPPYLDANRDGYLSAMDALLVINGLNSEDPPAALPIDRSLPHDTSEILDLPLPADIPEGESSRTFFQPTDISNREQLLLELINRGRADPAAEAVRYGIDLNEDLDPGEITTDPKQPLAPNQLLIDTARGHSTDMLVRSFFAHENLDGLGPTQRARAEGYQGSVGENIAWRGVPNPANLDQDQEVYLRHEALFLSAGHRRNNMSPGYRELGNGIRFGLYSTPGDIARHSIMVTENFGVRNGVYFITGVVYDDRTIRDSFYSLGEGIGGVQIEAVDQDGNVFATESSESGGYYLEIPPLGIYAVTASGGGMPTTVVNEVVVEGENQKVDFNTRTLRLGSISGRVFDDENGDGFRNGNESYSAGQVVYLDSVENERLDVQETTVTTDSTGRFSFTGLLPREYVIRIDSSDNQPVLWPTEGEHRVELRSGQQQSVNFGIAPFNSTPVGERDFAQTHASTTVIVDVLDNDSDTDGALNPSSVKILLDPTNGTARPDPITGQIAYSPAAGFIGRDAFLYSVEDDRGVESDPIQVDILVNAGVGLFWQNASNRLDVTNDGFVSARDGLLIINDLNLLGQRALSSADSIPPPFLDVNGDGSVSAIDALLVLNALNEQISEGELDVALASENAVVGVVADPGATVSRTEFAAAIDVLFSDEK